MEFIRFDNTSNDVDFAGNKAARLAELLAAGFRVPAFFVIGSHASHEVCRTALHTEIATAVKRLCQDGQRVAVRSSSVEEDGSQNSFAGQFDSFLQVAPDAITDNAYKVWDSAFSDHIEAYRESLGASGDVPLPAVLVQQMVDANVSGVAFSADPVSGDRNTAVVAATRGVGEALVSGECQVIPGTLARMGTSNSANWSPRRPFSVIVRFARSRNSFERSASITVPRRISSGQSKPARSSCCRAGILRP